MARLITSGFELNSKTAGIEFDIVTTAANLSLDTATVRTGTYSLKVTTTAAQGIATFQPSASNLTSDGFGRVYFNPSSPPSSGTTAILTFATTANTVAAQVVWDTTNVLRLLDRGGVQIGSDTAALTNGHWYRIELHVDGLTKGSLDARYVDCGTSGVDPGGTGTTIGSGANGTISETWARFRVGFTGATTATAYFDDVAVNDASGGSQNSYPGSGRVLRLKPNAAGDVNGFLVQVGGTAGSANNFTRVNEVTPDGVTTYNASAVLNVEDLFNVDNSGIGASDTISVVSVGGQFANTVAADATAAFKFEVEKAAAGTISQSAAIIPNSTTFFINNAATTSASLYPLTTYTDPDGAVWTQTTLDSMQVGYKETTANVQSEALSAVWAVVDYIPATVTATTKKLSALGVG